MYTIGRIFTIHLCNFNKRRGIYLMKSTRLLKALTGTALAVLLAVSANAAFEKTLTYADGTFGDVPADAWYAKEVASAYELGFMNGVADGVFSPDGNVTVAEGVTMASRVHAIYNGKTVAEKPGSANWYDMYVDYALANGIITEAEFDSYARPVKRYEMAVMFASAMPADYFTAKNSVTSIPDVAHYEPYYDELAKLYNAGVVMGSDDYGTFYPNNSIKRSETAAIINRVAIPENRLSGVLADNITASAPLYFVNDSGTMMSGNFGTYGWDFDNRGGAASSASQLLSVLDIRTDARTAMLREFNLTTSGKITLETTLSISNAKDGFHVILSHEDGGKAALDVTTKDGYWFVNENGSLTPTNIAVENKALRFKAITDLDNKKASLFFNGVLVGTYGLADSTVDGVNYLIFCSEKETTCSVSPSKTNLFVGYTLNETFANVAAGDALPADWTFAGSGKTEIAAHGSNSYDPYGLTISAPAGTSNVLATSFSPIGNKTCFEMKFRMTSYEDGTTIALTSGGEEALKIYTQGKSFYSTDGTKLYDYDSNVWQTLRFEVNTATGHVDYKIEGRKMGEGQTQYKKFDGVKVTLAPKADAVMLSDDFQVYNMFDDDADYVPAPKPVASPDYNVGMEVCDIWRNGFQFGWDYTSAFEELTPYLGFYDEGSTEAADWENKWLSEHGVDFKLVCWYSGTSTAPQKTPRNSFGLYGYMNSKYSDAVKYAIMWENSSNLPKNSEDFRNNFVPYWVEYYLKDKDRYFTVDNKAVFTIYRTATLSTMFGSNEQVKAEMDYLRQAAKNVGYDDLILLTTGGGGDTAALETAAAMGFDGLYAYNLGTSAFTSAYQQGALKKQSDNAEKAGIVAVPTVAVGFNNIALSEGTRYPNISLDEYNDIFKWVKTELLGKRTSGTWQKNMVILSNWNEFGEGHYIMPANLNGFGYMDVIRNAFVGDSGGHVDVAPNEQERARFNSLYYQHKARIRRLFHESTDSKTFTQEEIAKLSVTRSWDFTTAEGRAAWKTGFGLASINETGNSIVGKSTGGDFAINSVVNIEASEAHYMHITLKLSDCAGESQTTQLYFLTNVSKSWDEKKGTSFKTIADGKFHEYYVDLTTMSAWANTITSLRIDPINRGDCTFEISGIEFLSEPAKPQIYINNEDNLLTPEFPNELDSAGKIIAFIDPNDGGFAELGIYDTWDIDTKTLGLYTADHYVKLVMDSRTAETDAGNITFTTAPYLRDGIPALSFEQIATALGFETKTEGMNLTIVTGEQEELTPEKKYSYEFDVPGYYNGWTTASTSIISGDDGAANFKSESNGRRHDPVLNSPTGLKLPASRYGKIVVGLKYKLDDDATESINSTIFFHNVSGTFNENEMVRVTTKGSSSDGKFVEITFDMTSNPLWVGSVDQLRFDPFEAPGTFSVDYIRVVLTDPDAAIDAFNYPKDINADAEEATAKKYIISGDGANITLVEDPDNKGNMVYYAKCSTNKKSWTHLKFTMEYEPGATYQVDYDVKFIANSAGNPVEDITMGADFFYGDTNHTGAGGKGTTGDWKHYSGTIKVDGGYTPAQNDFFSIWCDPYQDLGVSFYVDNVVVTITEKGVAAPVGENFTSTKEYVSSLDETADNKTTAIYGSGGKVTIVEDPTDDLNKVYQAISPATRVWNYIQANAEFKAGTTYKYSYDIYVLENGAGDKVENATASANFCFGSDGSTVKNHAMTSFAVKASTRDGWHHVEGEFTIPADYVKSSKDYFGIYVDPINNIGISYLADNIKLSEK